MFKWISCERPKICYLLLYLNILNFVLLYNNGSSLYIQMKSTLLSLQYKVPLMNQTGSLFFEKGSQFHLACLLWSVVRNMRGHLS